MSKLKINASPMEAACFKFGLIAPVIQGTYSDASEAAYYRRVTQEPINLPGGGTYKYSPDTLERWTCQYRANGMEGLLPKSRKDKGKSRVIDVEAADVICNLISEYPRISAVKIHNYLVTNNFIPPIVSVRAVQRFIKENNIRKPGEDSGRIRHAFEMDRFGKLWQGDTAYLPYITPDGCKKPRRTYCIMLLDDHSRMIVGGEIFFNDNSVNFKKVLKNAVIAYGIPDKIYLDNGSPYISDETKFTLGKLGIVELHTPVRDGASKGKVERNFRTLRSRLLADLDVSKIHSLEQFNDILKEYIDRHNKTFHKGINERPIDRYLKTKNYIRIPISREWVDNCFFNSIARKVRKDCVIVIDNIEYDVPGRFADSWVDVRYNPDKPEDTYIFYNGDRYPITKTDRVENGTANRNSDLPTIDYTDEFSIDTPDRNSNPLTIDYTSDSDNADDAFADIITKITSNRNNSNVGEHDND